MVTGGSFSVVMAEFSVGDRMHGEAVWFRWMVISGSFSVVMTCNVKTTVKIVNNTREAAVITSHAR
jgi:hypothetical protein